MATLAAGRARPATGCWWRPTLARPDVAPVQTSGTAAGLPATPPLDVPYARPTSPRDHRYYWTVCLRDHAGRELPCAAPAWFETGQLGQPWSAASGLPLHDAVLDTVPHDPADGDCGNPASAGRPLLRNAFTLARAPVRARMYVAVLGAYRLMSTAGCGSTPRHSRLTGPTIAIAGSPTRPMMRRLVAPPDRTRSACCSARDGSPAASASTPSAMRTDRRRCACCSNCI